MKYTGEIQPQKNERGKNGELLYPYFPSPELVEAVNLSIFLTRPLLLKGEPGCGKTQLAKAIAYELQLPLETWHIKSTTRAKDGLYSYDGVGRLRDAQLAASNRLNPEKIQRLDDPMTYIRWGALGKGFQNSQRTIILIDEIDKADIDFPNDLLLELDEKRFILEETGETIKAQQSPIVLITSNDEKDLPDAFLRRCIFHYVEFPDEERLFNIVNGAFPDSSEDLINKAVKRFLELRQEMKKDKGENGKKVSTSELIDWFRVLSHYRQDKDLIELDGKLPYAGVLLKNWDDHLRYLKRP
jgi:MoxR-like ATPase